MSKLPWVPIKNSSKMRSSTDRRFHVLDIVLRLPLMVFALSCLYAHTESETSYTWKLDIDVGKVMPVQYLSSLTASAVSDLTNGSQETNMNEFEEDQELMLDILMSTVTNVDGTWKKTWRDDSRRCDGTTSCSNVLPTNNRGQPISNVVNDADEVLDCGKPVNFTYYDHLVGIQNRERWVTSICNRAFGKRYFSFFVKLPQLAHIAFIRKLILSNLNSEYLKYLKTTYSVLIICAIQWTLDCLLKNLND